MAFVVTGPDGRKFRVDGQATPAEAEAEVKRLHYSKPTEAKPRFADKRGGVMGWLDSVVRGGASGAMMNFDDEVVAGLNTVLPLDKLGGDDVKSVFETGSFSEAYDNNLALSRAKDRDDENERPNNRLVGQVGGGLATAVMVPGSVVKNIPKAKAGLTGVKKAIDVATRSANAGGRAALEGAGFGAVSGFGAGEGGTANRVDSAEKGAKMGFVIGGATGGLVTGLGPVIGRYWNALRGKGTEDEALAQLQKALAKDGYDVTSPAGKAALDNELAAFRKNNKPVALADTGRATRGRAGVALRTPSGAQDAGVEAVMARTRGQGDRLVDDIKATVAPRTDIHALDDALVAQREEVALPLREAALSPKKPEGELIPEAPDAGLLRTLDAPNAPEGAERALVTRPNIVEDETLQKLAQHPFIGRVRKDAIQLIEAEKQTLGALGQSTDHLPYLGKPDMPGEDVPLDMRAFDYIKRQLDDEVRRAYSGSGSFSKAEAGQLQKLRDAIRDRMREYSPEYGDYLDAYGGTAQLREALEEGRQFRNKDPEAIAAGQADRSDAGREFYRAGAARQLEDVVRDTKISGNPANRILDTPRSIERVEALGLDPADAAKLRESVEQERTLNRLPAELAGSATDERLAARMAADGGVSGQTPFNPTRLPQWAAFLMRKLAGATSLQRNEKINEAILPRLLETDPAAVNKIIVELERSGQKQLAEQLKRATLARRLGRMSGAAVGSPFATLEGN